MTVEGRVPSRKARSRSTMNARSLPFSAGMAPGLLPAGPWQAMQWLASSKPSRSSPACAAAAAATAARRRPRAMAFMRAAAYSRSSQVRLGLASDISHGRGKGIRHQRVHAVAGKRLQEGHEIVDFPFIQAQRAHERIEKFVGHATDIVELNDVAQRGE